MGESRTKNSVKNAKSGIIVQLMNKILAFAVRTIFIQVLNIQYLGINGLFTNILTLLSFAELGIGTAIIFSMYKPVAGNDQEKIKSLIKLYKKTYRVIGITIFTIGLMIVPFLKYLVKDTLEIKENINILYLLFLINTAVSYFFTYKRSIISAYQQERIINYISGIVKIVITILQIAFLIITHNYILYLIITILGTLTENIIISYKANQMFPFLKEKNVKELEKSEKKNIFSNVTSLVVYKIGGIILDGTDNVIMSAMINVSTVGITSNYTLIISSLKSVLATILNSITSSIGNLNAGNDTNKEEKVFDQLTFINYLLYSFVAVGIVVLINDLIKIWIGEKYLLGLGVVIVLATNMVIEGIRLPAYTYRVTLGLFQKGRITPYIATIVNVATSIILCHYFGVIGIFIGTGLAQLASYSWIDAYLIYKYEFKKRVVGYYQKIIIYFIAFSINVFASYIIISQISIRSSILNFAVKFILACIIPNCINLLFFYRSEEFKSIKKKFLKKKVKK